MKKRLCCFVLTAMLMIGVFMLTSSAATTVASGTCGDALTWELNDAGTLTVSGTGAMTDYASSSEVPWASYRDSIRYLNIKYGVTSIGDYAFAFCVPDSGTVKLPTGITRIGKQAFGGSGVEYISFPQGLTTIDSEAFAASALDYAVIGDGVTTIGDRAFSGCASMGKVIISSSVISIGSDAFLSCPKLAEILVSDENTMYSDVDGVLFNKAQTELLVYPRGKSDSTYYTLPEGVTAIHDNAFYECPYVTSVILPGGVTSIGANAFYTCPYLTNISLPDSLNSIGTYAFWGCEQLAEVTIPGGVTSIGEGTFACTGLKSVTFSSGVASIGIRAFTGCNRLTGVVLPESVTFIGDYAFGNCRSLLSVTILNSTAQIVSDAFTFCSNLTIYGDVGSTAEALAKLRSIPFAEIPPVASGACGKSLTWALNRKGTLTVSGTGEMSHYGSETDSPWWILRRSVQKIVIEPGVTSIGNYAFVSCTNLTEVTIPAGVVSVGNYAFASCIGLTGVSLPESVTSLGASVFSSCTGLTNIDIPARVTSVGTGLFYNCTNLTAVTIPESLTSISSLMFYNCGKLTNIILPEEMFSIGGFAFANCESLASLVIPDDVVSIGSSAFLNCKNLTNMVIPDGVTSISSSAFSGCSGLTSVTLPAGGTSIGEGAFSGCSSLTSVVIPGNMTSIGRRAFSDCSGLTSVTIPNSITSIPVGAFSGCSNLPGISLPDSITGIESSAFSSCTSLASITIPESVALIDMSAFAHCSTLAKAEILSQTAEIDSSAFYDCPNLTIYGYAESTAKTHAIARSIPFRVITTAIASGTCGDALTWTLDDAGALTISGTGEMTDFASLVQIPWANYLSSIEKVVIEEGVTNISRVCFFRHDNLKWIKIPASVTTISTDFDRTPSLLDIEVDENNPNYCDVDGILFNKDQSTLLRFPSAKADTTYAIPDGVASIGSYAFSRCSNLCSITVPASVNSIKSSVFTECSTLTSICVDENNEKYADIDGVLFNKAKSDLLCFPEGKTDTAYTVPMSVTWIGYEAFRDCTSLMSITIPASVTSIHSAAFNGCTNLTIHGYAGSVAETYAAEKSIPFEALSGPIKGGCGENLTWTLDDAGTLTVSGTGEMRNYSLNGKTWEAYTESITSAVIEEGVTSIGSYAFANCANLKTITLPDSLTSIGRMAFFYCENLTSLHIPAGVTDIGRWAFSECTSLPAITVAEENPAFSADENGVLFNKDKTTLVYYPDGKTDDSYTVPNSVLIIGQDAFSYCDFSTVVIPEGVTTLESKAFEECANLTKVIIPASVTSIDSAFERCTVLTIHGYVGSFAEMYANIYGIPFVVLPENLTWAIDDTGVLTVSGTGKMPNYNRNTVPWKGHLESITSVVIEEGVTSIGNYAFSDCANLVSVQLPAGLISIGTWAFDNCVNLKSITLPDSLTSIGTGAFIYCESLTSLIIPAGVTSIGTWAFSECISLPAFAVAEGNTAFSVDAEGVLFDKDKTVLIAYPDGKTDSNYAIPEGVTTVGAFAFNLCDSLISVTLPDSLTTLEAGAFEDCIGLTSMTIPAGVTMIGFRAFEACTGLPAFTVAEGNTAFTVTDGVLFSADMTRLVSYPAGKPTAEYTIPDTVTELASLIFYQCTNLTSVVIPNSVTSIGISAFSGCTALTIHGYAGSAAETYATANSIPFVALGANIAPTVNAPVSTESNISITAPEGGWKAGTNTFTVKADLACAVVVSYDGGQTYTRVPAVANADGSYRFTAENMTADTIVSAVPMGDANGDGKITNADITRMKAANLGKISFDSLYAIITDVNGDGKITNADITRMKAVNLGKTALGWN